MIRTVMMSLACASLIAAGAPSFAAAQTADEATASVDYRDLDLSTDKGTARLYERLWHAAQALCGPASAADMAGPQKERACVADAVDHAVQEIRSAKLNALHEAKSGRYAPVETASAR
jgi:UrcA family protein